MMRRKIGIVGGGPVGLAAALFMEKMGISYTLIERNKTLMSHPAAHLLNLRTMETLSELTCPHTHKPVHQLIYEKCEDINYFRYYRYQRRLLDPRGAYYVDDHFAPDPETKQKEILEKHAFARYVHLPQPHFVDVLKSCLREANSSVLLGHSVSKFTQDSEGVNLTVKHEESGEIKQIHVDYLIACDGKHSAIRNTLGIGLVGNSYLQSFLNIYFHSKKLSDSLNSAKENAMLHFVYNSDVIACLVNHSKSQGMFVMQIPSSPPYDDLSGLSKQEKENKAKTIIMEMIDKSSRAGIDDVEIKSTGIWKLSSEVIEKYYQGRVIFAGDSAHAFPPAGGRFFSQDSKEEGNNDEHFGIGDDLNQKKGVPKMEDFSFNVLTS